MPQFNALTVKSIDQLTVDSVEISFIVPDELAEHYTFEQGQFIVLRSLINGDLIERAYSICRAPYERQLSVAIKRVDQGVFSSFATTELKEGDVIDVSEPSGSFTCSLDSSKAKQYLFIAAGSGITPIMSILKMVLASEPESQCVLLFGNKTATDVMFMNELAALKIRHHKQLQIEWFFSQVASSPQNLADGDFLQAGRVHDGRIDQTTLEDILGKESLLLMTTLFMCGPEEMTLSLREFVLDQGVLSDNIKIELFSSSSLLSVAAEGASKSQISLLVDGEELEVVYEDPTESILDHALRVDPDLPYGCQNGSCGACQAKLVSGKVTMVTNYALSDSEVEEGYVLLCQAHPESNKVVISYE